MTRTTHSSALRLLLGAGVLATAALVAPADTHAQTRPEAALLNRLAPTIFIPNAFAVSPAAVSRALPGAVYGERALLGRTPNTAGQDPELAFTDVEAGSGDGAYALLGRSSVLDSRRRADSTAAR
jgi:hypothetical protein